MTRASCKWRSKSPGDGGRLRLSRRVFLASTLPCLVTAQQDEVITSFDLSLLDEWTVPNELFFVRDHFPAPSVPLDGWKLSVTGAVASPLEISYEELSAQARKVLPATLECAENPVGGGLVGHAEWTGLSMASILERAHAGPKARYVRLCGADGFCRSIPVAKARHEDTLIAGNMNGVKLPPAHGFPARAIVPGWYGMDSVKWLQRLEVLEHDDTNVPAASSYRRRVRSLLAGVQESGPVTAIMVKSAFSRPVDGAILHGRRFVVRGVAWAGEARVQKVEISTDSRKTWRGATLSARPQPYAWVHWEHAWAIPGAGSYELVVRATDDGERTQPAERPSERVDAYEQNSWQSVRVSVL